MNAVFLSAPHRVMFAAGSVQIFLAAGWWAVYIAARYLNLWPMPGWSLPSAWWHGALMLYGIFSFFIFGFLMTAGPKWVNHPPLPQRAYLPAFFPMATGWALFYVGLNTSFPAAIPAGLLAVALGWGWGWNQLRKIMTRPLPQPLDRRHAYAALGALAIGWLGLLVETWGLTTQNAELVTAGETLGIGGFLLPVFFIVSHRMVPFFTGVMVRPYTVWKPYPLLWVVLACWGVHIVATLAGAAELAWPTDALSAILVSMCSWKWGLGRSIIMPLLAMLHIATLWLSIGLALSSLSGLVHMAGGQLSPLLYLHALGVGYFSSMLIGMATRVTLGHSGRMLSDDKISWPLFWAFQGVAVVRVLGELLPGSGHAYALAIVGWLVVFGLWNKAHLWMYFKPRPDGEAG